MKPLKKASPENVAAEASRKAEEDKKRRLKPWPQNLLS
jgi:hypothetical protein